jgi:hypothetical protein
MTDLADKIYEATGLTLNAADVEAIGRMLKEARRLAILRAAEIVIDKSVPEDGATFEEIMERDEKIISAIYKLMETTND